MGNIKAEGKEHQETHQRVIEILRSAIFGTPFFFCMPPSYAFKEGQLIKNKNTQIKHQTNNPCCHRELPI